jgi:hypothetical protein
MRGRMGEWENGRMGEWENGRIEDPKSIVDCEIICVIENREFFSEI